MALDEDTIAQQRELLAAYRRTLAHLMGQAAQHGGEVFAPPATANGIAEARREIAWIKASLRGNGVAVDDEPNDTVPAQVEPVQPAGDSLRQEEQRTINTAGDDYAEGNIDKRQGVFVNGGTIYGPVVGHNTGTIQTTYSGLGASTPPPSLEQALRKLQQAVTQAQQRGDDDLADDLASVAQSLQAALKAHAESKTERKLSKLREAQEMLRQIAAGQVELRDLVEMLDSVSEGR